MIEWASPWAFWLLVPVALLLVQRRLTGANRLAVARVAGRRRWTLRLALAWLPGALRVIGLALAVVALARPRLTNRETVVEEEGLDILLTIDTSGSMREDDLGRASRLAVAKAVVAEFVRGRPHDRIGLVVFGEQAFTWVPLTLDHEGLQEALSAVEIGVAGAQATAVGSALAVSARRMERLEAPSRVIVLLTDGQNNAGEVAPLDAARAAAALGIRVYTVGVGARARRGLFGFAADGLDEPTLRAIADTTGGQYFRATDASALGEIYATIDQLEPSPAVVEELVEHVELYRRALAPGAVALLLSLLLSATWLRRGP